jgi:hypothetical protein
MKARCLNKKNTSYHSYGGRGVTVCDRWLSFANFFADMGECPEGKELDRQDNSKGYFKENCRWVTHKKNQRNRRSCMMLTYQGKTMCLQDWADEYKMCYQTLRMRLLSGKSMEESLKPTSHVPKHLAEDKS